MSEFNGKTKPKSEFVWSNIIILSIMNLIFIYIFYVKHFIGLSMHWLHLVHAFTQTFGITGGYHRLWAHKSYKANSFLQILIMVMATTVYQNSCYEWVRDHRLHHKETETDADPHNAKRGFFFSHMGWLCVRKHPKVKEMGKFVDMSDLEANPIVMFQHRYYYYLVASSAFIIPTYISHHVTGHSLFLSLLGTIYSLTKGLHCTWSVNSFAHLYGKRPYNKHLAPAENLFVVGITGGEGFHNFHHTFPQDYRAASRNGDARSWTTVFIDLFNFLGLAFDLKVTPEKTVKIWSEKYGNRNEYESMYTFMSYVIGYILLFGLLIL